MNIIFIHHSCFVVELEKKVLIFDWFAGDRMKEHGIVFHGEIPAYAPDMPIYVFASHKHADHFDMDVLAWAERYPNIRYIFSKDCKMSPHFLEKHGFSPDLREKIQYVSPCASYQVDGIRIETFRSTDAGVAYYVETDGVALFHAGDLNNWRWEGAGGMINGRMQANYQSQIRRLAGRQIDAAFVPLDGRLEQNSGLGMDYFLKTVSAKHVFPMHMWQDYSLIASYKKKCSAEKAACIEEITHENQVFSFGELDAQEADALY